MLLSAVLLQRRLSSKSALNPVFNGILNNRVRFPILVSKAFNSTISEPVLFSKLTSIEGESEAKFEIDAYLNRGYLIKKYKSAIYNDIENLIKRRGCSDIVEKAIKNYKRYGSRASSFIAFSAPSLTGKTQMAFTIESKLPLYFPTDESQDIYKNFYDLSLDFFDCARNDCKLIGRTISLKDSDQIVTLAKLKMIRSLKLQSVGFIKALIDDAKKTFNGLDNISLSEWINHFSNRTIASGSQINGMSISDFQLMPEFLEFVEKFYIFVDEFHDSPELVFIRNLCRSLSFTCVLASTNAKVNNLIGSSEKTSSRNPPPSVWSIVIPTLPLIPKEVISSKQFGLHEALNHLIKTAEPEETARMNKLADFIKQQCEISCPGIAIFINDFISEIAADEVPVNIDNLFTDLILHLSKEINERKNIFTRPRGMFSNTMMMCNNLVDIEFKNSTQNYSPKLNPKRGDKEELNLEFLLDKHLYYLKNPYTSGDEPFVLFRHNPQGRQRGYKIYTCTDKTGAVQYKAQCYFKEDEKLLMLACLIGEMEGSIKNIFIETIPNSASLFNSLNPEALTLVGDHLENIASASCIDSSHYTANNPKGTFEGVPLSDFISNLISNLDGQILEKRSERRSIPLKYGPELENIMKRVKVPFLISANMELPSIYREIFPESKSKITFGEYFRAPKGAQIDSKFDLYNDESNEKCLALVECKNWSSYFTAGEFYLTLKKAINYSNSQTESKCLVHFVFCNILGDFDHHNTDWSDISALTEKHKINVYSLKMSANGFEIASASKSQKNLHENPTMISIVIPNLMLQGHYQVIDKLAFNLVPKLV